MQQLRLKSTATALRNVCGYNNDLKGELKALEYSLLDRCEVK